MTMCFPRILSVFQTDTAMCLMCNHCHQLECSCSFDDFVLHLSTFTPLSIIITWMQFFLAIIRFLHGLVSVGNGGELDKIKDWADCKVSLKLTLWLAKLKSQQGWVGFTCLDAGRQALKLGKAQNKRVFDCHLWSKTQIYSSWGNSYKTSWPHSWPKLWVWFHLHSFLYLRIN